MIKCVVCDKLLTSNLHRNTKYCLLCHDEIRHYYYLHGLKETQKAYPSAKIRSIIENYKGTPLLRRKKWTDQQKIELLKMSCFVPAFTQAKIFNRPNAGARTIEVAWDKILKGCKRKIHGLRWMSVAQTIANSSCPHIKTCEGFFIVLWVDLERHLFDWVPEEMKAAINMLAKFQRNLWGDDPRKEILELIELWGGYNPHALPTRPPGVPRKFWDKKKIDPIIEAIEQNSPKN